MKTVEFDQRPTARGLTFLGKSTPEKIQIRWMPAVGNTVLLQAGGLTVISRIVSITAARKYTGEVIKLRQVSGENVLNIEVGDIVCFSFDQIFSCSA